MTDEEKFEWLYDNWVNGNRKDARDLMKKQPKTFVVNFIQYIATHFRTTRDVEDENIWHNAVAIAWGMVRE
jgi:hypothetical protein